MKQKILSSLYVLLLMISVPIAAVVLSQSAGAEGVLRLVGFPEDMIISEKVEAEPTPEGGEYASELSEVTETVTDPAEEANAQPERVMDKDVIPSDTLLEPKRRAHAISDPNPVYETVISFGEVDASYFDDALFIGDSRTVGLKAYGDLGKATFFCKESMSIYAVRSASLNVSGYGSVTIAQLLKKADFGKIYVMLGINEIGSNIENTAAKYADFINWLKEEEPDAIIYVMANMLVSEKRSSRGDSINNTRLSTLNSLQAENADGERVFYIDMNELFDDGKGNVATQYSGDGVHPYGKYYKSWGQWIREHAVIYEEVLVSEW